MYNRYVAQPDGSYRKSQVSEPAAREQPAPAPDPPFLSPGPPPRREGKGVSIGSFFKNLLPPDLDTEDLIVILLLLLISEHRGTDGNQALLTLGAYLFL